MMKEGNENNNIVLAFAPIWGVDMPPISIGYLASYLRHKNIKVTTKDLNLLCYKKATSKIKNYWEMDKSALWVDDRKFAEIKEKLTLLFKECTKELLQIDCDIIGFSVYSSNRLFTKELIKRIKEYDNNKLVIVGGRGIEAEDERKVFENLVDVFVKGEGEKTLEKIISSFYSGKKQYKDIPGVVRLKDKENKQFIPRAPILPLDKAPFPKYRNFNIKEYKTNSLPLLMGKGCIGECAFCDDCHVMGKFRSKEPRTVLKEIKYHLKENNIRKFFFNDLSINSDVSRLEKLCDLIIEENLSIQWIALAIPYSKMNYPLLCKMNEAGCITLNYGVESGSDKVLKAMKKIFTVKEAEKVIRNTRKAGIDAQLNFITGFPGEDEREFEKTLDFIRRNKEFISGVTNINTCNVLLEADLFKRSAKYSISFPDDIRERDTQWYIEDSNTPQIRTERVKKVINLLKKLDIPIVISNVWEEEAKRKKTSINTSDNLENKEVMLVTLPPWGFENPPIGLSYLAEYVRKKDVIVEALDLNIELYNSVSSKYKLLWHVENKNFWSNEYTFPIVMEIIRPHYKRAIRKIISSSAKIIGFSVVDPKERITIKAIKDIKEQAPEKKIILGGPATSTEQQRKIFINNIPHYIDAFVIGEGEETLYKIVNKLSQGKKICNIPGVLYRVNGKWNYNKRKPIDCLSKLPFPTYNDFNLNSYDEDWLWVEWSRGCIGKCSFCKNYKLFPKYRPKPAEWVVEELEYHVKNNGISKFFVADNLLNGDLDQLSKICDLIIKNDLDIDWGGAITPRKELNYEFFRKMKQAGCQRLQIGLESGSNKVLENMRKTFTVKTSEKDIKEAKTAGIKTEIFIMIGFPGEGKKEFQKTYEFIKKNSDYIDTIKSINTLHLVAGTDVYENSRQFNMKELPAEDWHYLWETKDGNDYQIRKNRGRKLLKEALRCGINVKETNLEEGKEGSLEKFIKKTDFSNLKKAKEELRIQINSIQELEKGQLKEEGEIREKRKLKMKKEDKKVRKIKSSGSAFSVKRNVMESVIRVPLLIFLLGLGFIIDFYIWVLKKVRKCIIFPGS